MKALDKRLGNWIPIIFPTREKNHRKMALVEVKDTKTRETEYAFSVCECEIDELKEIIKKLEDWFKHGKLPTEKAVKEGKSNYIG